MKPRLVAFIALSIITTLLNACAGSSAPEKSVRVAYPPIIASLTMFVSEDKQLFSKEGLKLEKTTFVSSNDMINALVADQVDLLPAVSLVPVINLEIQYPGRVRLFSHSRMRPDNAFDSVVVKTNSPINALTDLAGKKIGVFPGTSATKMLILLLTRQNIDTKSIQFIQLPPQTQLSSLESGAIDALFTYEPTTTIALKSGRVKKIFGSVYASLQNPCPIGASVVSRAYEKANPVAAANSIRAIDQSVEIIRQDPSTAKSLLVSNIQVPSEIAAEVNFVDVTLSNEIDVAALQSFIDLLFEAGEIPERIDAHRLTDPTK